MNPSDISIVYRKSAKPAGEPGERDVIAARPITQRQGRSAPARGGAIFVKSATALP